MVLDRYHLGAKILLMVDFCWFVLIKDGVRATKIVVIYKF